MENLMEHEMEIGVGIRLMYPFYLKTSSLGVQG